MLTAICGNMSGFARNVLPADVERKLSSYDVVWATPSATGSMESMPIGNGDITANVWVERDGDLMMYIGKSDTWSEAMRLLKVGRVRISMSPNPFVDTLRFEQRLSLHHGMIEIAGRAADRNVKIKVWVDANNPVVNVEAESGTPLSVTCTTELMRPADVTFNGGGAHPLASSYRGLMDSPVAPSESADRFAIRSDRVVWYHRNESSFFNTILERQNAASLIGKYPDPYLGRTFGAAIIGRGMEAVNDSTLATVRPEKKVRISIPALTAQTSCADEWLAMLDRLTDSVASMRPSDATAAHLDWWDRFWNRSWVFLSGDEDARRVTQAYLLQRYMMACQSRGAYPVKFNGGTLTFDYNGKNGDYRTWGPGYWYQNCRLYYWPLTASGDFDMKRPWFDMYMNALPIQKDMTRILYGHDGAFFPETMNFFGLYIQDDWGWNNNGTASQTRWIRYHYEGALEMLAEMLDYYRHTGDEGFAKDYVVPFATEVIRFFARHWPVINNQYRFIPANSLEQFWDCLNPIDYIAGLTYDIRELKQLPAGMVSDEVMAEWDRCLAMLPPIPVTPDGSRLRPAEEYGVGRNFENPECYAIFPFRLYGIGRDGLDVARATFDNRIFKQSNCWSQCAIQAACLGLDGEMRGALLRNATALDPDVRFPAFWKPGSDYTPDLDNGGVLALGVQNMLLQNVDDKIAVIPALPEGWSVDFKLHAYGNTQVRAVTDGRVIKKLDVSPAVRLADVKAE